MLYLYSRNNGICHFCDDFCASDMYITAHQEKHENMTCFMNFITEHDVFTNTKFYMDFCPKNCINGTVCEHILQLSVSCPSSDYDDCYCNKTFSFSNFPESDFPPSFPLVSPSPSFPLVSPSPSFPLVSPSPSSPSPSSAYSPPSFRLAFPATFYPPLHPKSPVSGLSPSPLLSSSLVFSPSPPPRVAAYMIDQDMLLTILICVAISILCVGCLLLIINLIQKIYKCYKTKKRKRQLREIELDVLRI